MAREETGAPAAAKPPLDFEVWAELAASLPVPVPLAGTGVVVAL